MSDKSLAELEKGSCCDWLRGSDEIRGSTGIATTLESHRRWDCYVRLLTPGFRKSIWLQSCFCLSLSLFHFFQEPLRLWILFHYIESVCNMSALSTHSWARCIWRHLNLDPMLFFRVAWGYPKWRQRREQTTETHSCCKSPDILIKWSFCGGIYKQVLVQQASPKPFLPGTFVFHEHLHLAGNWWLFR